MSRQFEDIESGKYDHSIFETLKMAYRPYKYQVSFVIFLGFLGRVFLLANANAIGLWVDQGLRDPLFYLSLLTILCLFGFFFIWIFRVVFSRLSARAVSQLYDEVTWRTSRYPMSFFDKTPVGRIVTRFSSDYGNVFRLFGGPLAEFFAIVFDLIAISLLAIYAHPSFAIIVLAVGFTHYFIYRLNQQKLRILRRQLSASRSPSIAHFAESTQGVSLIRVFDKYDAFSKRFENLDQFFLSKKRSSTRGIIFYSLQMNFITACILLITGLCSIWMVQNQILTIGKVGIIFTFIALSGNTIQMFFEWLAQLEEALVGVERLDQYLRLPLEQGSKIPRQSLFKDTHPDFFYSNASSSAPAPLQQQKPLQASIHIENLNFRYHPKQDYVLKNLNLEILPGEKIGIIGRTGSGKSSLIQALFHLYPLDSGVVRIEGLKPLMTENDLTDPATIDLQNFRKLISYVPQESTLFRGTLRQNLDLSMIYGDEELIQSLTRVGLKSWYQDLSLGLNTFIEEKGKNLSLGERQLICLARASLKDSPVVILDEATSSIDPQTEELLEKALREIFRGKTQIIIAHRLSTLKNCDRVLWIHQGQIKAFDRTEKVLHLFHQTDLTGLDLKTDV